MTHRLLAVYFYQDSFESAKFSWFCGERKKLNKMLNSEHFYGFNAMKSKYMRET